VELATLLDTVDQDTRLLLAVAETKWDRPVPHCPDWDAAGLVAHVGGGLQWIAAIVSSHERVSRRTLEPAPKEPDDLPAWYLIFLSRVLDVLGSTDPETETWTWSPTGDHRASWWSRRLGAEMGIHRWDMEHAVFVEGGPFPGAIDGEVAAAGIEEFLVEFLPGLLEPEEVHGITGTLHLQAVDGPTEWWIDLGAGGSALPAGGQADTTVRGTRSDLLLWLVNRGPLESLEASGNRELLDRWGQLAR
jgi:uncharacterized protein (TIGR03083 family)